MCRVDGDAPDAYSVSKPIARKEHRCGECRRPILPGEQYERHGMCYEGTASSWLVCSHCAVLTRWLVIECGGAVQGEVIEDIEEHASEYQRADLKELAAWARAQWMYDEGTRRNGFRGRPIPGLPHRLQLSESEQSMQDRG